jgi:hypothetical protein
MNATLALVLLATIRIVIPFGMILLFGSWLERRRLAY